ncbi:hypothetical protein G7B40_030345 [Aetokthonos hydrillicola Thurmond2011]|jgi:hypothetical protein|uniref:Uncharacterized protein n=1 Tax=Aetokthonos hydrillicola Thurmond2011 TaxID=2712845 RepID=A0AAP5IC68_9CYAN|nr:hypothetical protein [Aetokthonos hydrillicola CCALA 1050]MBW4583977.1 hypothetical protein [Aetokthonos hydrillicola CCALA 1050]MDR9898826.1 hypothetical protein [Aetokthonos hydrillicola Thurmond2011]
MNLPIQSAPIFRGLSALTVEAGITPSGTNTQCCGSNCLTKYCFIGLSARGCDRNNNPYIACIWE